MNSLNEFYKQERKRVFEPDPYFAKRMMARLNERPAEALEGNLWDTILGGARPVMAVALTLLLALVGVHMFLPVEPSRGMIEAYFFSEVSDGESLIFSDSDAPLNHDVLEQLMVLENDL